MVNVAKGAPELKDFQGTMRGLMWHDSVREMVLISLGIKEKMTNGGKGYKARYQLAVEAKKEDKDTTPYGNDGVWVPSLIRAIQGHSIKFIKNGEDRSEVECKHDQRNSLHVSWDEDVRNHRNHVFRSTDVKSNGRGSERRQCQRK